MNERKIEWDVAEVLEYDYTYQYITEDKPDTTVDRLFERFMYMVNLWE